MTSAAVARAAQLGDRRQVDARVGVDEKLHVGRERRAVVRVGGGQRFSPVPSKLMRKKLTKYGSFPAYMPLALNQICRFSSSTLHDRANRPVAFRDLVLHLAGRAVVQVEVVPAVALRHPDDLAAVVDVAPVLLAGVAEERRRLLRSMTARALACCGVDLDDAVDLVSALVVLERDARGCSSARRGGSCRTRSETARCRRRPALRGDVDEHGPFDVEHVARLGVQHASNTSAAADPRATTRRSARSAGSPGSNFVCREALESGDHTIESGS